jgi:hypothetical protein
VGDRRDGGSRREASARTLGGASGQLEASRNSATGDDQSRGCRAGSYMVHSVAHMRIGEEEAVDPKKAEIDQGGQNQWQFLILITLWRFLDSGARSPQLLRYSIHGS